MHHGPLFGGFELVEFEPIHLTIPMSDHDPRAAPELPPWIVPHYVPELHPDDVTVVDGLPTTTVERTLLDMAECSTEAELRAMFARADAIHGLDAEALRATRARVEWRPSLALFDRVMADFVE